MTAKDGNDKHSLLWILFWVYAVFFIFLLLCRYIRFDFLSVVNANRGLIAGISSLCLGFVLLCVAAYGLFKMRHEAVIAFFCLALLARCSGLAATFFFPLPDMNAGSFWLLPIGDAGTLLFYLLVSGGIELAGRVGDRQKKSFLLCLIPVACYLVPVLFLMLGFTSGIWPIIYSFLYVTPPVITLMLVIRNWLLMEFRGIFISLIILVVIDLTPLLFLLPVGNLIPGELPVALVPLGLILFTLYIVRRKEHAHG